MIPAKHFRNVESTNHMAWADLCRFVAIFGVVLIHSVGSTFYQYGKIPLTDWLIANFIDSLVRCAVPLFLMLSGALILCHAEEIVTLSMLWRRIRRVLFPLLVWSAIYLGWISYHSGLSIDWLSILSAPAMYHLGFAYYIIGIYMLLPVFQVLFRLLQIQLGIRIYLFIFWFLSTCVSVYMPLPLLSLLNQTSFFGLGGYFVMGGIIVSLPQNKIPSIAWVFIFCASILTTFGLTWYFCWKNNAPIETAYIYTSPNVLVSTISAFVLFTRVTLSESTAKIIKWMSERVFLIFFVHILVLEYIRYSRLFIVIDQNSPILLSVLILSISTMTISLILSTLIRFIPGSKSVFG